MLGRYGRAAARFANDSFSREPNSVNAEKSVIKDLLNAARTCNACEPELPLGARPILQVHPDAGILIASQAPGRIAHESGIPFQDPSGRRLRDWMGVEEQTFYDARRVAILPMSFCYPGRGSGGDLPPRPECAPLWRQAFLDRLDGIRLVLLIGVHAQRWHGAGAARSVTENVRAWLEQPDDVIPLPHPSPRNNAWFKRNPWFERDVLPRVRCRVAAALGDC